MITSTSRDIYDSETPDMDAIRPKEEVSVGLLIQLPE